MLSPTLPQSRFLLLQQAIIHRELFFLSWCRKVMGPDFGKWMMGIIVIDKFIFSPTIFGSLIRHLIDSIDFGFFFIGYFIASTNRKKQRIGDFLARTIVVRKDSGAFFQRGKSCKCRTVCSSVCRAPAMPPWRII